MCSQGDNECIYLSIFRPLHFEYYLADISYCIIICSYLRDAYVHYYVHIKVHVSVKFFSFGTKVFWILFSKYENTLAQILPKSTCAEDASWLFKCIQFLGHRYLLVGQVKQLLQAMFCKDVLLQVLQLLIETNKLFGMQ